MNKQTSPDLDKRNTAQDAYQEETIDDIMASIMKQISHEQPSPVDSQHEVLIEQADPLDYDIYNYDDKPAVILGQTLSPSSFPKSSAQDNKPELDQVSDSSTSSVSAKDLPEQISGQASVQQLPAEAVASKDQSVDQARQDSIKSLDQLDSAEEAFFGEAAYNTAEMQLLEGAASMDALSEMPEVERTEQDFPLVEEVEHTKSIPFIPPQEANNHEVYQVAFDFGDTKPSKLITVLPFILHLLLGIAAAAYLYVQHIMQPVNPISPIDEPQLINNLYLLAALVLIGIVLGLLVAIVSRIKARDKRGWIASSLTRAGVSTLLCVILWAAAMFVCDAIAHGLISL